MSQPVPQGGVFIQVPQPHRNFQFIAEPHQLREQIKKAETLANALWILAPAFIDSTAVERMGLLNIDKGLETFRIALRDFLCCELEQKLADQLANPLPTEEEIRKMQAEIEKQASDPGVRRSATDPAIPDATRDRAHVSFSDSEGNGRTGSRRSRD